MAMASTATAGLSGTKLKRNPDAAAWVRPSDWRPLPAVAGTEQKFVGLHAVFNHDSNHVAMVVFGAACTVDWGDGSAPENYAVSAQIQHVYNWADLSAGTVTSQGFRQAVVTVTAQAGQTMTGISLNVKHTAITTTYSSGWLDIRCAGSSYNSLYISRSTALVQHRLLAQFEYVTDPNAAVTGCALDSAFLNCSSLVSVLGLPSGINSLLSTFSGCTSLMNLPPVINALLATNASLAFNFCGALVTAPTVLTANVTNFSSMFNGCSALTSVPMLNTSKGTNFSSMFAGCVSLQTIPLIDTGAGTSHASMLSSCYALTSVPLLDLHSTLTTDTMFNGCTSLTSIPAFNTALNRTMANMFNGCSRLVALPMLNTSAVTTWTSALSGCTSLQIVPAWDMSAGTALSTMFTGCTSLASILATGIKATFSIASCRLSAAALNTLYTNLATVTALTITVTSNVGVAADDPTIATAKGWTVTGS